ncbi:MAG: HAD family hydrolase [Spirochaetia bacterium]
MSCQAFLFDMDGVLFDTEMYFMELLIEGVEEHYAITSVSNHMSLFPLMVGKTSFQMIDVCCAHLNMPPLTEYDRQALSQKVDQQIMHSIDTGDIPMKPGLMSFLTYLHSQNHPIAVCSNASSDAVHSFLTGAKIKQLFSLVLSADTVDEPKPSPCIYLAAMKNFNISPSQTIIFEDSKTGLMAAIASGAQVCILDHFYNQGLYPELPRIHNFEEWQKLLREQYGLSIY